MAKTLGFDINYHIHAEGCADVKRVDELFMTGQADYAVFDVIGEASSIDEITELVDAKYPHQPHQESWSELKEILLKPCTGLK